jgi:hypothetical protein
VRRWFIGAIAGIVATVGGGAFLRTTHRPDASIVNANSTVAPRPAAVARRTGSFSASFALENGDKVTLDYIDDRNYRFSSQNGGFQTYVLDGRIYLYAPADATQPERAWLYGKVATLPAHPRVPRSPVTLHPTTIPAAGVAAWGAIGAVGDVEVKNAGQLGIAIQATVASNQPLSTAQWAITSTLLPAMDMSLCGDAVQAVTQWWPAELTGSGHAVVATSAGVRLDGTIHPASGPLALPGRFAIQIHPLARL